MDHNAAEEAAADKKSDYDAQKELIQSICADKSVKGHVEESGTFVVEVAKKNWASVAAVAANEVSCLHLLVLLAHSLIPHCQQHSS